MSNLDELLDRFVTHPGGKHKPVITRSKYHYRLRSFVKLHGRKTADEITTDMLLAHINSNPDLAEASKAILKSCFHALFAFCELDPNPAKALPRYRETPRRIIIPDETAVKRALDEAVAMCSFGEADTVRDGLIFALSVVSGNRRGELRNLPMNDLKIALKTANDGDKDQRGIFA